MREFVRKNRWTKLKSKREKKNTYTHLIDDKMKSSNDERRKKKREK